MSSSKRPSSAQTRAKIEKLLGSAFKRKQLLNPGYSKRALARDLRVTPGFITKVFKGAKLLPKARLEQLTGLLELDLHERMELFDLVIIGSVKRPPGYFLSDSPSLMKSRSIHEGPHGGILSRWYNLAVLQALGLEAPLDSIVQIQKRLRLTGTQIGEALETLERAGEIVRGEGGPVRRNEHIYIPSGRSRREVRAYHESLLLKARQELVSKVSQEDFHRRLITGFTFSANAKDIERMKAKILEFLDTLSKEASSSPGTDVYQCNVQFFPLTSAVSED